MSKNLTDAMAKVVDVLSPLESDERIRIVNAALTILGEGTKTTGASQSAGNDGDETDDGYKGISAKAIAWMKRNNISSSELENFYHIDSDGVTPLTLLRPASNRSQQAVDTYLMKGFAEFLESGEPTFSDQEGRDLCEHFGCLDPSNHSKIYKSFGNKITGSKSAGWKLTAPGINAAGEMIQSSGNA